MLALVLVLLVSPLFAQDQPAVAENPLAQLKDQVKRVLEEAKLPFTDEQERAVVLMMEDRRKASEDLFGDLLDFKAGPAQGQAADRLRSAIQWMENEFVNRLQDYLTPQQLAAWNRSRELAAAESAARQQPARAQQNQTQYVRINNNAFTSEDNSYRNFNRAADRQSLAATEVIQRGGAGAWHGNLEFLLKDDALNAGRRFAKNKPPYQERQTTLVFSGPIIPERLSSTFTFKQNEAKNADTIRATKPDGVFSLGITKPTTSRSLNADNIFQLAESTALSFNVGYTSNSRKNQGVGSFTLPERAYTNDGDNWDVEVRQFTSFSARSLYETRFKLSGNHDETIPQNENPQINVLDSFNGGGSQNKVENTGRTYEFSSLYSRLGEKVTLKTGYGGAYRKNDSISQTNFGGTYTFSSLDAYRLGTPLNYRVNRGTPELTTTQYEMALFAQNDVKVSPRLTMMAGLRYELQTNLSDHNNIDPRLGLAYAIGRATVIRAGAGVFHQRMVFNITESMRRLNGTHQYEIVIDTPSYPDPFQGGTVRNTFPSVRVTGPDVAAPYSIVTLASVERTFLSNLTLSVQYDRVREVRRLRLRNLNAPMDITSPFPASCKPGQTAATCMRPDPTRGNVLSLESTGTEVANNLRVNYRQRFSIFNVSVSYTNSSVWLDTNQAGAFGQINVPGGYGQDGLGTDSYNLNADWSRIIGAHHTANGTLNAQLPLGIFLTGTVSGTSDRHYSITTGKDDNQDTVINDRPAGVARNAGNSPGSLTFNFNISKAIFFGAPATGNRQGARKNANLFANMTNAFNHPNYSPPSGVMTSPTFGKFTSAGDPREIEVGLRFQF